MYNNNPITQLQPITSLNGLDVIPIVDVTDLTQSPVGTTKKVTMNQINDFVQSTNSWIIATSGPITLVSEQGYIADGVGIINFDLPLSANVGDQYHIEGLSSNLFQVNQNAGQQIIFGNTQTTVGTGGRLMSTNRGDGLTIMCVQKDLLFKIIGAPIGNFDII